MRPSSLILLCAFAPQAFAARGPFSGIINYFSGNTIGNKPELTESQLIELGIGDHAYDTSKILNITDSNWKEYLGPQNTGEWLVEFTAHPDFCASCELIDLAFNDVSYGLATRHPELKLGRVLCSDEIILSTKFLISRPPTLYHISPATRTVRRIPPEVGKPAQIVEFYDAKSWEQTQPWTGVFNPLSDGPVAKAVLYFGIALKQYTLLVEKIPRWLGLIIIGTLSSFILNWLHGVTPGGNASGGTADADKKTS